jgi:hypothetical protein
MIMLYDVRIKTDFISSVAATKLLRISSTEIGSALLLFELGLRWRAVDFDAGFEADFINDFEEVALELITLATLVF